MKSRDRYNIFQLKKLNCLAFSIGNIDIVIRARLYGEVCVSVFSSGEYYKKAWLAKHFALDLLNIHTCVYAKIIRL